jgi:hypothetical protein
MLSTRETQRDRERGSNDDMFVGFDERWREEQRDKRIEGE